MILRRNPECYQFIIEEFKDDENCLIIAGRKSKKVWDHAKDELKNNEFIYKVIRLKSNIAEFENDLKTDIFFIEECC